MVAHLTQSQKTQARLPNPQTQHQDQSANVEGKPSEQPEGSSTKEKLKKAGIVAGVALVAGAAAFASAPVALAAVGFTSSGVAAGSLAAAYQATLGRLYCEGQCIRPFAKFRSGGNTGCRTNRDSSSCGHWHWWRDSTVSKSSGLEPRERLGERDE
ncbi:hypothetical protein MRX96_038825 [Rhipicephalus microplus]